MATDSAATREALHSFSLSSSLVRPDNNQNETTCEKKLQAEWKEQLQQQQPLQHKKSVKSQTSDMIQNREQTVNVHANNLAF